jgi:endonuclease III
MSKFPFDEMMDILKGYLGAEVPAVTRISKEERSNPFLVLVGTLLSLRTKDEVTERAMARLLERARTPEEILMLPVEDIQQLIYPVGFYKNKASTLRDVSRTILEKYEGIVPDTLDELLKIKGVGRKTANLVLTEGYHVAAICVDTHVHRISNRIGIVSTTNPYDTEMALRKILPKKYWIIYNTLLVRFGQRICKPLSPLCTVCPISHLSMQVGVTKHR